MAGTLGKQNATHPATICFQSHDKKQKKRYINRAKDCFTSASNVEVGEAQIEAALFVGACFYALRCIDPKTTIALENGEYDRAFQLADAYRRSDGKPPLDLIEKLLQLPYLRMKYGTFEDYQSKWEPKRIEAPQKLLPSPQDSQSLSSYGPLSQSYVSSPPTRPVGVTILAVLVALQSLFVVLASLGAVITGNVVEFVIVGILAVATLALTWGIWTMRAWAFWTAIVIEAIYLLAGLATLSMTNIWVVLLWVAIPLAVLICLFAVRNVRDALRGQ